MRSLFLSLLFTAMLTAFGCSDGRNGRPDGDGGMTCTSDDECDDGLDCTVDSCTVDMTCSHAGIDGRCDGEMICEPGRGCVDEASCSSDADCDDGFDCTLDSCGVGGECRNMALDELCDDPTLECNPDESEDATGCAMGTGCSSDGDCDDGVDCTVDTCTVDNTCANDPIDEMCADGESCSRTSGCFTPMDCTTDDECQDDDFCNGREFCMEEFGCMPAPEPRTCDDSNDCTIDSCDSDADMCVFACDTENPECDCEVETPCEGTFALSPTPSQMCALGSVSFTLNQVTFSCPGDVLSVEGSSGSWTGTSMTQNPRPDDGTFDVEAVISGDCEERYRLEGMFTDTDTFEATFTTMFVATGGLGCADCSNMSWSVTGTRM